MSETKAEAFFDKAVFGGYDRTQVDEFVEEARKMLSWQKKENEVLKQKMQVLADALRAYQENGVPAPTEASAEVEITEPSEAAETAEVAEAAEAAEEVENVETVAEVNEVPDSATREAAEKIADLMAQITSAQDSLQALKVEKASFLAAMTSQYEVCLKQYEACIAALQTLPEIRAVSINAVEAPAAAAPAAVEPEPKVVEEVKPASVAVKPAAPSLIEEQTELEETENAEDTVEEIAETIVEEVPVTAEPAFAEPSTENDTAESVAETIGEIAEGILNGEEEAEKAPEEAPVPSVASSVAVGDSVYLQTDADMANLSYEEALAMVLRKNGIIQEQAAKADEQPAASAPSEKDVMGSETLKMPVSAIRKADAMDDQATKVMPKIVPQAQPDKAAPVKNTAQKKEKSEKKTSFFRSLKDNIHAFIYDEDLNDEDDDLALFMNKKDEEQGNSLQFGKGYNVKRGR